MSNSTNTNDHHGGGGGERTPLLSMGSSRQNSNTGMLRGRHHNSNSNSNNNNVSMSSDASGTTSSNTSMYSRSVREFDNNNNNNNGTTRTARQQQQGAVIGGGSVSPSSSSYLRNLPNDGDIMFDSADHHDYDDSIDDDDGKVDRRGGFLHKTWRRIRVQGDRVQRMILGVPTTTATYNTSADIGGGDLSLYVNNNNNDSFFKSHVMEDNNSTSNIVCGVVNNGEDYYEDSFHDDEPRRCSFGTREEDGIWLNLSDRGGTLMAGTVWLLILYSAFTILLLAFYNHLRVTVAAVYCTICCLALTCHAKTTFTNPGAVPSCALPIITIKSSVKYHSMCSVCQSYKPHYTHHCRICNRCIVRMDHHCPWMNNCIGVNNLKHFVLFLVYTWIGSVLALIIFAVNYFFCISPECEFNNAIEVNLVRVMTFICTVTVLFTSSMLMNVIYGITTGIGTIDRLKKKADDQWHLAMEEPIPLRDIVGISTSRMTTTVVDSAGGNPEQHVVVVARLADWWWWFLPVDPQFDDYDRVMGYATTVRLLREHQQQSGISRSPSTTTGASNTTVTHPSLSKTFSSSFGVRGVTTPTASV